MRKGRVVGRLNKHYLHLGGRGGMITNLRTTWMAKEDQVFKRKTNSGAGERAPRRPCAAPGEGDQMLFSDFSGHGFSV